MQWVRTLSIGRRLWMAFGVLLLLMFVQAGTALLNNRIVERQLTDLALPAGEAKRVVNELRSAARESAMLTSQYLLLLEFPNAEEFAKQLRAAMETYRNARAVAEASLTRKDLAPLLQEVHAQAKRFDDLQGRVLKLAQANRAEEAIGLRARDSGAVLRQYAAATDNVLGAVEAEYDLAIAQVRSNKQHSSLVSLVALAFGLVCTIALGVLLSRSIIAPLARAVTASERLARGELDKTIEVAGRDETAQVLLALRNAVSQLHQTLTGIRGSSDAIAMAAREIADGNSDLSSRTEQQSSRLQQTTASVEQMTGTIRQNAEAAKTANALAGTASAAAERGGTVVSDVVQTMAQIRDSSRKINDIISVIDGIAFQTNILALNAAVEAARAGEHGRGFAVVATEVRTLAQRSAQAAREIKSLITDSVNRVNTGSHQVEQAGDAVQEIVAQVQRVSRLLAEIAGATAEQSTGIGEVNQTVAQLDEMTQQNAALVEQSAAAAVSLKDQADALARAVAAFRLQPT